ncbi:hypothetical protein [Streptomyces sp. NPDC017524]
MGGATVRAPRPRPPRAVDGLPERARGPVIALATRLDALSGPAA